MQSGMGCLFSLIYLLLFRYRIPGEFVCQQKQTRFAILQLVATSVLLQVCGYFVLYYTKGLEAPHPSRGVLVHVCRVSYGARWNKITAR